MEMSFEGKKEIFPFVTAVFLAGAPGSGVPGSIEEL